MSKRVNNRRGKGFEKNKFLSYEKQTKGAFGNDKVRKLSRHRYSTT